MSDENDLLHEWDHPPDIGERQSVYNIELLRDMVEALPDGEVITCRGRGGKPVTLDRDWNKVPWVVIEGLKQHGSVDCYQHPADLDTSTLTKDGPHHQAWFMAL